ncbi:MAG: TetR/AcrR family transcriptional regulator [Gallionella sp.]
MNQEVIKRRMPSEERQSEIVRVAIHLAAEKGIDSVTTQDMADAMKVTQGGYFQAFSDQGRYLAGRHAVDTRQTDDGGGKGRI